MRHYSSKSWRSTTRTGSHIGRRERLVESISCFERLDDTIGASDARNNLGILLMRVGDLAAARTALETSLADLRREGDTRGEAWALKELGEVLGLQGNYEDAAANLEQATAIFRESGEIRGIATALTSAAQIQFARTYGLSFLANARRRSGSDLSLVEGELDAGNGYSK